MLWQRHDLALVVRTRRGEPIVVFIESDLSVIVNLRVQRIKFQVPVSFPSPNQLKSSRSKCSKIGSAKC